MHYNKIVLSNSVCGYANNSFLSLLTARQLKNINNEKICNGDHPQELCNKHMKCTKGKTLKFNGVTM